MKDDFNKDDEFLDELFDEENDEHEDDLYSSDAKESSSYGDGGVEVNDKSYNEEDDVDENPSISNSDYSDNGNRNGVNVRRKFSIKKFFSTTSLKILASSLAGCVLIFSLMLSNKLELFSEGKVGKEAVMLLYNFNNINELANNLKDLKGMMTTKCYYKTTVLNSDKSLNTYLKFQKKSTKVNIIESKPGFVLYSLTNENITESRLFIFSYKLNLFGDICEVREFEAIDFYSEVQSVSDEELDKLIEQWESEGEPSSDEEDDPSNYNDEPYLDEAGLRETQSTEESNE